MEAPAVAIWEVVRCGVSETATAAMDFMGWTGMGMWKSRPVAML